jgi:hypothetical protein
MLQNCKAIRKNEKSAGIYITLIFYMTIPLTFILNKLYIIITLSCGGKSRNQQRSEDYITFQDQIVFIKVTKINENRIEKLLLRYL